MNLIAEVIEQIERYKNDVPEGYKLLKNSKLENDEDLLSFLRNVFEVEEAAIEQMKKKQRVTDDYEDGVRRFAGMISIWLVGDYDNLYTYHAYQRLMMQKHMAYSIFAGAKRGIMQEYQKLLRQNDMYMPLYKGLVDFYQGYYGHFADNEEAIELLCEYYPKDIVNNDIKEYEDKLVVALYQHISNAGTLSDRGYAYRGIDLIREHISKLPISIVKDVLRQYSLFDIINNRVHRHQIFAMIEYSQMEQDEKRIIKFEYLDFVMLANSVNRCLLEQLKMKDMEVEPYYHNFAEKVSEEIKVFKKPMIVWKKEDRRARILMRDDKPLIMIVFSDGKGGKQPEILIKSIEKQKAAKEIVNISYAYDDWNLLLYNEKDTEEKIRQFIIKTAEPLIYSRMTFSLLYINEYRGMKNQSIDFDHEFVYERENGRIEHKQNHTDRIPYFYGQLVHSLSCVVGRNGTGKSSIVDFLRETFFILLKLVNDANIRCESGYIREEEYRDYNILDEAAQFLVVFKFDETPYFLTNIKGTTSVVAKPFEAGVYHSTNELSKVAYFSNMLMSNQKNIFSEINQQKDIAKIMGQLKCTDYSEKESYIKKRDAIEYIKESERREQEKKEKGISQDEISEDKIINKELCYQLTFLRNVDGDKLCAYIDIDENKKFEIYSQPGGEYKTSFTLSELKEQAAEKDGIRKTEIWEKYIGLPEAGIGYFSSGQYAKFSFLAKLYWFLEGYRKAVAQDNDLEGVDKFSREEALLEGETALIFIDEGELYYHPEWQRRYIKTLLELINSTQKDCKVQIVITTNSPFIISDILQEDVIYLFKEADEKKVFEQTLGQNIHKLLRENFFMDYTIGEYAREFIEKIMLALRDEKKQKLDRQDKRLYVDYRKVIEDYFGEESDYYAGFKILIDQIGEVIYRDKLMDMLEKSSIADARRSLEELKEEKRRLEEKIEKLERNGYK